MSGENFFPIEVMDLADLHDDPHNPMVHEPGDIQRLRHSIETHGLLTLPVVNSVTGYIVGGHARVEVLRGLGWHKCPIIVVEKDEDAEAAANVALNASYGHQDPVKLATVIRELEAAGIDIDDTGLKPWEIARTLDEAEAALQGVTGDAGDTPEGQTPDKARSPATHECPVCGHTWSDERTRR